MLGKMIRANTGPKENQLSVVWARHHFQKVKKTYAYILRTLNIYMQMNSAFFPN